MTLLNFKAVSEDGPEYISFAEQDDNRLYMMTKNYGGKGKERQISASMDPAKAERLMVVLSEYITRKKDKGKDYESYIHDLRVKAEMFDKLMGRDETELLLIFNGWLDSMRFDDRLTEDQQNTCWEMLSIVHRIQEGEI